MERYGTYFRTAQNEGFNHVHWVNYGYLTSISKLSSVCPYVIPMIFGHSFANHRIIGFPCAAAFIGGQHCLRKRLVAKHRQCVARRFSWFFRMIFIEKTSISYQNSGERISGKYSDIIWL